jgi:hypothetical protein
MKKKIRVVLGLIFIFFAKNTFSQVDRKGKDKDYNKNTSWRDLKYPVKRAKEIAKILQEDYDFDVTVIENPEKETVIDELNKLTDKKYKPDEQLLVMFIGHGVSKNNDGYFITKEVIMSKAEYHGIGYTTIKKKIANIDCRHKLLLVDACNSGSLFYKTMGNKWESEINVDVEKALTFLPKEIYHMGFTSSKANRSAPDNSAFSSGIYKGLLEAVKLNKPIVSFRKIWEDKLKGIKPSPESGALSNTHDVNSDFYFFQQDFKAKSTSVIEPTNTLRGTITIDNYLDEVELYFDGKLEGEIKVGNYKFPLDVGTHLIEIRYKNNNKVALRKKIFLTANGHKLTTKQKKRKVLKIEKDTVEKNSVLDIFRGSQFFQTYVPYQSSRFSLSAKLGKPFTSESSFLNTTGGGGLNLGYQFTNFIRLNTESTIDYFRTSSNSNNIRTIKGGAFLNLICLSPQYKIDQGESSLQLELESGFSFINFRYREAGFLHNESTPSISVGLNVSYYLSSFFSFGIQARKFFIKDIEEDFSELYTIRTCFSYRFSKKNSGNLSGFNYKRYLKKSRKRAKYKKKD